ncbi:DUF4352 domain-containing protein [Actinoplanes sp. LDG1-06]|uniref:DUF4352 domain-containing protein n=1 Tax=Paractinoplanes ovalisporus TaxID=2810368 RepID=A0ABS2AJ93_9ACTN|nr:DUF4352 domain-containing protein [Actinoplanes ovalisporus]MBM2619296.1 DUF4352 domain-containing protein [Actinoplanes ovalisporus]
MTEAATAPTAEKPTAARPRRWPWAVGVLVLLLAATGVWFFVLRDDGSTGETVITSGGGLDRATPDGSLIFTVNTVRCGLKEVGDDLTSVAAKGTFCLVDLMVMNAGSEPALFASASQKAYDAGGGEYSTDAQAEVIMNPDLPNFLSEISPSGQTHGTLVFDVPDGIELSFLLLHGSYSSPGAPIALR